MVLGYSCHRRNSRDDTGASSSRCLQAQGTREGRNRRAAVRVGSTRRIKEKPGRSFLIRPIPSSRYSFCGLLQPPQRYNLPNQPRLNTYTCIYKRKAADESEISRKACRELWGSKCQCQTQVSSLLLMLFQPAMNGWQFVKRGVSNSRTTNISELSLFHTLLYFYLSFGLSSFICVLSWLAQ